MLKTVRALDSVYGDRDFSCIIDSHIYNINDGAAISEQTFSSESDDLIDAIESISNFLGSEDWRYINQTYYCGASDLLPHYEWQVPVFRQIFRRAKQGYFNYIDAGDASGEISINDYNTGLVDYSLVTPPQPDASNTSAVRYRVANYHSISSLFNAPFSVGVDNDGYKVQNQYFIWYDIAFFVCNDDILNNSGRWDIDETTKIRQVLIHFVQRRNNNPNNPNYGDVVLTTANITLLDPVNISPSCATWLNNSTPDPDTPDTDPYAGDGVDGQGKSDTGGGTDTSGAINWTIDAGDATPVPNLPTLSVADTGFITLYNPSATQLKNLANYMWGNLFDITTWKKVVADPMDAIIGLSLVPVNVPSGGSQVVTVGNISTGISLTKASTQFVEVDCGTVKIDEIWKAYLDYSPYTKISIYLPYIGSQELDIDLYQNSTVGVKYHIDILSGACVAYITVNGNVICQFSGQCAVSIPITSQDFTQTITALATLVASGVGVVATGGMSAPVQGAAIAGMATAAANTAANVISSKPIYAKTGNMAGSNGLMGVQTPYLIIEHARQCAPAYQNRFTGYPSYITKTLSSISGFTQIQDIRLDNIGCTSEERNEILQLLRSGVVL